MSPDAPTLRIQQSTDRLEQIANLRARGIAEHVDLPQLVVCGDQSAGKSSVLTGLTGLIFPRDVGLCTRFATEIIMTHQDGTTCTTIEIIAHDSSSAEARERMKAFKREVTDLGQLPQFIAEAAICMGLRGVTNTEGPAFGRDVLRIEHRGPIGLHLSVVDLPGLIANPAEDQTDEDVATVHDLVDTYLQNSRTIILAVVQAGNDIANQGIIKKARLHDPSGTRTVGIITKPDLINEGTQSSTALLARNESSTRLTRGFFLLKNPSPKELEVEMSSEQRELAELEFFKRAPWNSQNLDMQRVGIANLRGYLQQLLDQHIESELPKVRKEIQALLRQTEHRISNLGEERPTIDQVRAYLSRLAMRFHGIAKAASLGDYHSSDSAFFSVGDRAESKTHLRLRALIHNLNTQFSDEMRQHGASIFVRQHETTKSGGNLRKKTRMFVDDEGNVVEEDEEEDLPDPYARLRKQQQGFSEKQMSDLVLQIYKDTRGRELPGDYNHIFLTELFHLQSSQWEGFARVLLALIVEKLHLFVQDAAAHLISEDRVRKGLLRGIEDALTAMQYDAEEELSKLCSDKSAQPITYNHYYTDTVQKARHAKLRSSIEAAVRDASAVEYNNKLHVSNIPGDLQKLVDALQVRVQVNMDQQACDQAREALNAYYKVARKTFVDNVAVQVIERHLLRKLPDLLTPDVIAGMSGEELLRIGGESEHTLGKRQELQLLRQNLIASLAELQQERLFLD